MVGLSTLLARWKKCPNYLLLRKFNEERASGWVAKLLADFIVVKALSPILFKSMSYFKFEEVFAEIV